jgi:MFS family permease
VKAAGAGLILPMLAASQFLMALDSSVMNVSMATIAADVGTSITGIQTAITLYTLVMASLMVTGGKVGGIIGRRRAFVLGCVIYGVGSLITGMATSLPVLLLGWSLLEGLGAVLIMPAVVALIAVNFTADRRPRAYGLVATAGAIAIAVGPLLGGAATTYLSWRWVFLSEVLIVLVILALSRRIHDLPPLGSARLDVVGAVLSATGLGIAVFGVLRSSEWGWFGGRPGAPTFLGTSRTFWFITGGLLILWCFLLWENRMIATGREPLIRPSMLDNTVLRAGLTLFGFQFLVQAGVFFVVPLFLSVVLELPALDTGLRLLPLSLSLLLGALGVPRLWPDVSPRRAVRVGILLMLAGVLVLRSGIDLDASAAVVALPMVCMGLGVGTLASQLGALTVSSVSDELSGDIGGLQNTATNLGASLGTALAGSILIAALTSSFLTGIQQNPDVPESVKSQAHVRLASGAPFLSETQLTGALVKAGVNSPLAQAIVDQNRASRVDGLRAALGVLALLAALSLFFTGGAPQRQPGVADPGLSADAVAAAGGGDD